MCNRRMDGHGMVKKVAAMAVLGVCAVQSSAEPVEFDTAGAHVIVIRPLDIWSGDKGTLENSLEAYSRGRVTYNITIDGERLRGSPTVFQDVSDHPVTEGVKAALEKTTLHTVNSENRYSLRIGLVTTLPAQQYSDFATGQSAFYRQYVVRQGDPQALEGQAHARKVVGGILSAASLLIPVPGLSAGGSAQVMLNSGITDALGRLPDQARPALVPAELPAELPPGELGSTYSTLDVWRVDFKLDVAGEILIAYRGEKTAAAENEALVRAIVSLVGADTTPEAVRQARQADFERREAIWNDCVSSGQCGSPTQ
jgi:hypothetical protein